jgi:murein DD-endopeptidase MepM/ murein hydrolase activator NlpD
LTRFTGRFIAYSTIGLLAYGAMHLTPPIAKQPLADLLGGSPDVASQWVDTVARGEGLSTVLARGGLSVDDAASAIRSAPSLDERRIPAGMAVTVRRFGADSAPSEILLQLTVDRILRLHRTLDGWTGAEEKLPWTTDTLVVSGIIATNLYLAIDSAAGALLPRASREMLAWNLADIYEYKVDMSRELQVGDRFRVLFERSVGPNGAVRIGNILAANMVLSGHPIDAIRFVAHEGTDSAGYFDQEGRPVRSGWLRSPVQYRRISSGFGNRLHPILGTWKQHTGTDYAANAGTPVRAISDAIVVFAGERSGYGNVVELRHPNGFVTRYAHLRAFAPGIRSGRHVDKENVIGYVGMTGLATAPHLHFEIIVNGVQRNPRLALTNMQSGDPLAAVQMTRFQQVRSVLLASLLRPEGPVRVVALAY